MLETKLFWGQKVASFNYRFNAVSAGEKVLKIGQRLAKLCARVP